ncbi:Predicted arabinose efflux permease, MFS family [Paraburkholderia fungorum]|uniref:Predicted arabinose efflux permease, MFS family n=1 Tax=Paraburkholderia fungorum TaxID=134537 RepID=A0A1H1JP03_9BURK|nr:MFS transporter [Paraburkholderia fungorum]SDR51429.1 Predicted arabinose efflux permease, MFS family [Paraburkholderia fungorum]
MSETRREYSEGRSETSKYRHDYGLWALTFSYVLSQFFRSYVAVISTELIADFRFSPEMFGWFAGAFFLVFAAAQIPVGMLFDRFGVRTPTAMLMGIGAFSAGLLASATSAWLAILAQAGIGLGCAPIFKGLLNYVLANGAGPSQTRAVTTASAVGMAGALAAASPLGQITAHVGWRPAMTVAAAAMFCCMLGVARFVTHRKPPALANSPITARGASGQRGRRFWTLAPACLAMSVGSTFRTSWGGPYLADVFHFDIVARGNAMTIASIVGTGASFCIPFMVRFWSPKRISLSWLLAGALAALVLAVLPDASSGLGVGLICVLFSVGAIHPLVMSQARAIVPAGRLGLALGFLNSLVFLGVALASGGFGKIAAAFRHEHVTAAQIYAPLFMAAAMPLLIGAAVYVFSPAAKIQHSGNGP